MPMRATPAVGVVLIAGICCSPALCAAPVFAVNGELEGQTVAAEARRTDSLPRPPGGRTVILPRAAADKPQETSVAVNPRDPGQVIVSYHRAIDEGSDHDPDNTVSAHVAWSADGGQTWAIALGTTHKGYRRSLDTSVAFDLHGHAFLVYLALDKISLSTRHGIFVHRSFDGGRSWDSSPTTIVARPEGTKPLLEHFPTTVVDNHPDSPYAGNLYVSWDRILGSNKSEMMIARSTDDGQTWSAPMAISSVPASLAHSAAVGSDGAVYITYAAWRKEGMEIVVAVSRDGGLTFEPPRPVARTQPNFPVADFPRAGRTVGAIGAAVDSRTSPGRLFVVWGDYRNGDRDILAVTSDDGGATWTAPVRVNDDARANGRDQIMTWLAVDPGDGAAYVLFYDRRGDSNNLLPTVTLARSVDGGRSFVNYAWSDVQADPKQACLGDYIGLAASGGRVYGAWTENVPQPASLKPVRKGGAKEKKLDPDWPAGPSAIRVGIADFRRQR